MPVCEGSSICLNWQDRGTGKFHQCYRSRYFWDDTQKSCLMEYWNECLGDVTYADGLRYIGEFKMGEYHRKGRLTYADGRIEEEYSIGEC